MENLFCPYLLIVRLGLNTHPHTRILLLIEIMLIRPDYPVAFPGSVADKREDHG